MTFDLRIPIGVLFTLFGLILTTYGFFTRGSEIYEKSLGRNINLQWGIVLLVFGLFMLLLTRLGKKP
jgi:intracellular septation protein A